MKDKKKVKVVTLDCCLCGDKIDEQVIKTGAKTVIWAEGHNASPLKNGKCCTECNMSKVVPFRIICSLESKLDKINKLLQQVTHSTKVDGINNVYALKYQSRLLQEVVHETELMDKAMLQNGWEYAIKKGWIKE